MSCSDSSVLYVGTYTDGSSEGIYSYDFDSSSGELVNLTLKAKTSNPSFLAFGKNENILYAVNEINDFDESQSGSVSAFSIDNSREFTELGVWSSFGAHPCHVSFDPKTNRVAISNYTGGNVAIMQAENNGGFNAEVQVLDQNSSDEKSHAHFSSFDGESLWVSDLGRNKIFSYSEEQGNFVASEFDLTDFETKSGPRHFAIDDSSNKLYSLTEYGNTLNVFSLIDGKKSQTINTKSKIFQGDTYAADVKISADQKYLYATNRGENSIALFSIAADGALEWIENKDIHGDWPRNFTLDPSGKWLLVANQSSNNISVFSIGEGGKVTFVKTYEIGSPVCLLFKS
jgi:6-phosphogluconolactonase